MRYSFGLALRSIRTRPVQTLIPAVVIGLAIALAIVVAMLADGTKEGIIKASDPFGVLVIGAKGSSQQLVINSILLQDEPIGNIAYSIYEDLNQDTERVQLAVPLAFGDNVGGARIIGTNHNFFELRTSASAPPAFQIAEGRVFTAVEVEHESDEAGEHAEAGLFEAVLGSRAAEKLGLEIGDQFRGTHGTGPGIASDVHEEAYTVVGILKPSDTAYDAAVFTQIASVWHVHEIDPNNPLAAFVADDASSPQQVTAVLVVPASFIAQNQIFQEFYIGTEAQAAFPGQELVELFDIIDQAQELLNIVSYLVLVIASLTVFLSMYNVALTQEQSIAIMRGLGSSQLNVFWVIVFETLIVTVIGVVIGRAFGYPTAVLIADVLSNRLSIPIPLRVLPNWELILLVLPLAVGIVAGLLPGIMAYRVNVIEKLFPS